MRRFESRIVRVFCFEKCCGERTTQHAARHHSNQARALNKLLLRVFTMNAMRRVALRCGAVTAGVNELLDT